MTAAEITARVLMTPLPCGLVSTVRYCSPDGVWWETAVLGGALTGVSEKSATEEDAVAVHDRLADEALHAGEAYRGEAERYEVFRARVAAVRDR